MGGIRSSGEYAAPVTQEQFSGFVQEFHIYTNEARSWMATVNSQLADGQSRMAVLQSDTTAARRKSDEDSSKINLLVQKEAVRTDRELVKAKEDARVKTQSLPALAGPPPKPTVWERLKDDLVTNIIKLIAIAIIVVAYHEFAVFAAAHPSISADGEGFTAPAKHERGREPINAIPASAPSNGVSPLGPPTHP